jgi:hypothetical protein
MVANPGSEERLEPVCGPLEPLRSIWHSGVQMEPSISKGEALRSPRPAAEVARQAEAEAAQR